MATYRYLVSSRVERPAPAPVGTSGTPDTRQPGIHVRFVCMAQSIVARRRVFHKRRDAKRAYVQHVKETTPCVDCGRQFPYYVMDLDHVRGEKRYAIGTLAASNLSFAYLVEEISNCDVVCANCHRIRTFARKKWQQERLATDEATTGVSTHCVDNSERYKTVNAKLPVTN